MGKGSHRKMKEDIAHLYRLVFQNKFKPEHIRMYTQGNYTNIAITFARSPNSGTLTHYIHIYR